MRRPSLVERGRYRERENLVCRLQQGRKGKEGEAEMVVASSCWCLVLFILFRLVHALFWRCLSPEVVTVTHMVHQIHVSPQQSLVRFSEPKWVGKEAVAVNDKRQESEEGLIRKGLGGR